MSANTRLDSLHDLVKHKANLRATCRCGRAHVYDAQRFCRYALVRGWNTQEALMYRIRCQACGQRGPNLRAVSDPPTPADPFPQSERAWRLLTRRMRD